MGSDDKGSPRSAPTTLPRLRSKRQSLEKVARVALTTQTHFQCSPVTAKTVMEQGLTARYDQMGADGTYNIQRKHRQESSRAFDHQRRASAGHLARIDMLWRVSDRGQKSSFDKPQDHLQPKAAQRLSARPIRLSTAERVWGACRQYNATSSLRFRAGGHKRASLRSRRLQRGILDQLSTPMPQLQSENQEAIGRHRCM